MSDIFGGFGNMAGQALGVMRQMGSMANEIDGLMQVIRLYKGGGDPMQLLSQLAKNDPRMGQALQMVQGKSPQQLQAMAQNMANERGIDLGQLAAQMGLQIPR